jgi:hypothetical protein
VRRHQCALGATTNLDSMPHDSVTGLFVSSKRLRAVRRRVAYHEAGHAVIARALGVEIADISMEPSGDAVAHVTTHSRPSPLMTPAPANTLPALTLTSKLH